LLHWYVLQVIVKVLGFNSYSLLFRLIVPLLILGIVVIIVNVLRKVCLMDSLLP
jgi:hypothetical protein